MTGGWAAVLRVLRLVRVFRVLKLGLRFITAVIYSDLLRMVMRSPHSWQGFPEGAG